MIVQTVSQLPRLGEEDRLTDNCLFEVEVPTADGKYDSRAVDFRKIKESSTGSISSEIEQTFEMNEGDDNGPPISLRKVKKDVDSVLSGENVSISGKKLFRNPVGYAETLKLADIDDNDFITREMASETSQDYGNFLSPSTTYVDTDPENSTPNTVFDEENFMVWRFDQDGRDSSQFILDQYSNQKAGPVFAKHTGNLVVYGWLADNGNVAAQEAWVGLFGYVTIGDIQSQRKRWVALQIQPWIIGQKSQALQYVGFNVPVKKNMQLKIMTGFPVNTMNSGFQNPAYNTLTFIQN
jgi:hypothetical protein